MNQSRAEAILVIGFILALGAWIFSGCATVREIMAEPEVPGMVRIQHNDAAMLKRLP